MDTMKQPVTPAKPGNKKKVVLISLGVLATGTIGYLGYDWWKKRKRKKELENEGNNPDLSTDSAPPPKAAFVAPARNDNFPLKKGSKGERVKQMQEALMPIVGKEIFGKGGADGDFGPKTEAALVKAGYPKSIDESTYNVLIKTTSLDATTVAKELYYAALQKNLTGMLTELAKMKTVEDYNAVNAHFKTYILRGDPQTLVTGALSSFSDEASKQKIRLQFTRMGLKYDGNKFSLSGIEDAIITVQTTLVWANPRQAIRVPSRMVLGKKVCCRGKHTMFESCGRHFLVETNTIKSY